MSAPRMVLVTHPVKGAARFAARLVGERLAACVNLVAVESIYRWQGRVERARERLLVLKTTAARCAAIERFLEREHPYDVPECVVLDPARVEPRYLAWLAGEVRTPPAMRGRRQ
jgi:periplasmic divalent cation tolerance protein